MSIHYEEPFLSYNQKGLCVVCLCIFIAVCTLWLKCMCKISKMNKCITKEKFNLSYYLRGLELP